MSASSLGDSRCKARSWSVTQVNPDRTHFNVRASDQSQYTPIILNAFGDSRLAPLAVGKRFTF